MPAAQPVHATSRSSRALALASLLVALCLTWQAAALVRQDLVFTAAETEVGFWGRGEYQPDEPTRARIGRSIDTLLADSPGRPDYLTLAASYFAWQAYWAQAPEVRADYNRRALGAQYGAQQSRPAYRQGWATMLGYAARADGGAGPQALARRRLSALAGGAGPAASSDPAH